MGLKSKFKSAYSSFTSNPFKASGNALTSYALGTADVLTLGKTYEYRQMQKAEELAKEQERLQQQQLQKRQAMEAINIRRQARIARADILGRRGGLGGSVMDTPLTALQSSVRSQLGLLDYTGQLQSQQFELNLEQTLDAYNAQFVKSVSDTAMAIGGVAMGNPGMLASTPVGATPSVTPTMSGTNNMSNTLAFDGMG